MEKKLQKLQGCRGLAAAACSGVRRSRDSSRAARRTAVASSRAASATTRERAVSLHSSFTR
eukprot:5414655-Prymnesium_polylepis.1